MARVLLAVAAIAIVCILIFGGKELETRKKERDELAKALSKANERIVELERQKTNIIWIAGLALAGTNAAWFLVYRKQRA